MDAIADDAPPTVAELERFRRAGHAWVAAEDTGAENTAAENTGTVVAYLLAEVVDNAFHIEQVTVHPDAARRGVGQTLIARAADCARDQGLTGLTLTTFTDVPWNAPYYERLGFRRLSGAELTPGLRAIRAAEAEHGLDRWPRVCMRREP